MIVHDGDTLNRALIMAEQGPVRYSDRWDWVVLSSPEALERKLTSALSRDDVAIVVPVGQEQSAEDYYHSVKKIQKQRKLDEMKRVLAWVSEHPEVKEAKTEQDILRIYRKVQKEELGG